MGSIRHGGDRKSDGNNCNLKTQSEDSLNGTKPKWGCGKFSTRQNEILLNIPKQSGGVNQYNKEENSERLEKSKAEVTQEMGYTRHEVSDYQRMAQNQAVTSSGIENANTVKLSRCIKELERIYGIKNGGDRKSDGHYVQVKNQDDLASELEMSKKQMSRFKSLTDLIPELQDAVQSGQITATTAMGFVKKLSSEEQKQLAEQISGKGSQKSVDHKTNTCRESKRERNGAKNDLSEI